MSKNEPIKKTNPSVVTVEKQHDEDTDQIIAKTLLRPAINSAQVIKKIHKDNDTVNVNSLIDELELQNDKIKDSDLTQAESMLIMQAHTLDALFMSYSMQAAGAQNIDHTKTYMNIALKTQSQCRTTLETLSEIKNPKPYIQNNKAQYQQINNGATIPNSDKNTPRARENSKLTNELLEDKTDEQEWMDGGTPQTPIRNDKNMETVGTKYRRKN